MPDQLIQQLTIPPPAAGLVDWKDPASAAYPENGAPLLENIRVGQQLWETRYGMSIWSGRTLPSSGGVRFLASAYAKSGKRYRLAARNTALYDWDEGDQGGTADTSWQAVSGGGSLADVRMQGIQYGEYFYFTDRTNQLKRYKIATASAVTNVAQPAKPVSGPTAKPRHWRIMEDWSGSTPFGWTESSTANLDLASVTATDPPPMSGNSVAIRAKTTSASGKTITKDVANEEILSHAIAFYLYHPRNQSSVVFETGSNASGETPYQIKPPKQNDWYVFFCPMSGTTSISFKRFRCINSSDTYNIKLGPMILPGRLSGKYYYRTTHFNSTTGAESTMSDLSNSGEALDLSVVGVNFKNETDKAFRRTAALNIASDSGTDATTDKIRIYRSGGVGSLTKDSSGRTVWIKVGEINDHATTLSNSPAAGTKTLTLTAAGPVVVGDWLIVNPGGATEDFQQVATIVGTTVTLREGLANAHVATEAVRIAFLDNVANETIDPTNRAEPERDDPPTAVQWIARSPQHRLWLFNYLDSDGTKRPAGVCISNRATPERKSDYEVFPRDVDPITRQDLTQGFRFNVGGGEAGEEIAWGGFFNGTPTILTKTALYQVYATSQADFSGDSVQLRHSGMGCINGETVKEVNGALYWVTEGRRVVRWDGSGAPEFVSHLKVNRTLEAAPAAYVGDWFADAHTKRDGTYYCLFFAPSGQVLTNKILEFNTDSGAWELVSYAESGGTLIPWTAAMVPKGSTDTRDFYAAVPSGGQAGKLFKLDDDTALTDDGAPIRVTIQTPRVSFGSVARLEYYRLRQQAASDSLTVKVDTGGSQYGDRTHTYTESLAGTGDVEVERRTHSRDLWGRWVQFTITAVVSNRPTLRDFPVDYLPVRDRQV